MTLLDRGVLAVGFKECCLGQGSDSVIGSSPQPVSVATDADQSSFLLYRQVFTATCGMKLCPWLLPLVTAQSRRPFGVLTTTCCTKLDHGALAVGSDPLLPLMTGVPTATSGTELDFTNFLGPAIRAGRGWRSRPGAVALESDCRGTGPLNTFAFCVVCVPRQTRACRESSEPQPPQPPEGSNRLRYLLENLLFVQAGSHGCWTRCRRRR